MKQYIFKFFSSGLGLARHRLQSFISEYNNKAGLGGNVIQSPAFKALLESVVNPQNVSFDKLENPTPEQLKVNNPKLSKLDEILNEHFQRSRALGNSSRAIVFSQWRDSVEEIVHVLNGSKPLLQAKKFVGQGSASTVSIEEKSSKKDKGKKSYAKVTGMTQKEQQRVLKEFRNGVHNILVCTW